MTLSAPAGARAPSDVVEIAALCDAAGVHATGEQVALLSRYLDLLERWNATYNLTAVREREAMRTQHLADCIAAVPSFNAARRAASVLDVGSGGGLPGVVVAALLPDSKVTCVDAVGKKVAFIRHAAGALGIRNLRAVHARVETLDERHDLIVSRAYADLATFVASTRRVLTPGGCWAAMKGRRPDDELTNLPQDIEVFHVEHLHIPALDAERCLIWMRLHAH